MATTTLTEKDHAITLSVAGVAIPGFWKTFSGGGISSESTTNRPGGRADRESLPGVAERENVTITRERKWDRDGPLVGPGGFLDQCVEDGEESLVMVQYLNHKRQPVGQPKPYRGVIQQATDSELDSEGSGVQMITVVCTAVN